MSQDQWNPNQYEKFKKERLQPFFDLMDLLDSRHHIETAVDLGCGTGEPTKILHERFHIRETRGLDSSDQMLQKAQSQNSTQGLSFQKMRIEDFQVENQYDLVFSNAALQWCSDHPQLFQSIRKALKPEGQILVQMPMNFDYPTHTLAEQVAQEEPFRTWLGGQTSDTGQAMLKPEEYALLLFQLGFQKQNVFMKVYPHILEDREQVIEWVKGTMLTSFQKKMEPEQFEVFLRSYRTALFRVLRDEKPFFYPFKRILLWGHL